MAIVAIGHAADTLGLLCDRGDEWDYVEVPAPLEAYLGLQQVAALTNEEIPLLPARSLAAAEDTPFSLAFASGCP